jgi:dTDP-4-amino-4,6-dideoxygalactose transaminase
MVPYANLTAQHAAIRPEIEAAVADVMFGGEFTLGRHVRGFEAAFASYCGVAYGVGVNSGTSAFHLALLAHGIGSGDEVITAAFSFVATIAAILYSGARPVLVDVDPATLTIEPSQLEKAISPKTRASLPVHLYGQPADMEPIRAFAERHGLVVIEDAAQAHGAEYHGRRVGGLGHASCFSFYPGKNRGAVGDAGMVLTNDSEIASCLRKLRDWGHGADVTVGRAFNARMAAIQAAVLAVKLGHLDGWTGRRRETAGRYDLAIAGPELEAVSVRSGVRHARHIYALRARDRGFAIGEFRRRGIETRVHYPKPLHLWEGASHLGYRKGSFPIAEAAAAEVLSIPVHPELSSTQVERVVDAISAISSMRGETRAAPLVHTHADNGVTS